MILPPWAVLHVPHDSTFIPDFVRDQFVLPQHDLEHEIDRLTDHHTLDLFTGGLPQAQVVRAAVSRLVVDVERFADDQCEPMAARGLGAIYTHTLAGTKLRRELDPRERAELLRYYYEPHHELLKAKVDASLAEFGTCMVIDCHSFPNDPLPYESAPCGDTRPDICIGTDPFHTSATMLTKFRTEFGKHGWRVHVDHPFAGALVPADYYRKDPRVYSILVEVNRSLYLTEGTAQRRPDFAQVAHRVQLAFQRAAWLAMAFDCLTKQGHKAAAPSSGLTKPA